MFRRGKTVRIAARSGILRAPMVVARRVFWWLGAVASCAVAVFLAYGRSPPRELPSELAGCACVLEDDTCAIVDSQISTLAVWLPAPVSEVAEWTLDGSPLVPSSSVIVQDGRRFTLKIDGRDSPRKLRIFASGAQRTIRLGIERSWPELDQAQALRSRGAFAEAIETLEKLRDSAVELDARSRATGALARLQLQRGHVAEARRAFEAALELDRRAGRRSSEVRDALALAFTLIVREQEFVLARAVLEQIEHAARADPESAAHTFYMRGLLAAKTGEYQHALEFHEEAERRSVRLDVGAVVANAREQRALALQSLGRREEAAALFAEIEENLPAGIDPCERARLLINSGWASLLHTQARAAGPVLTPSESRGRFTEALALMREPCRNRMGEAIALINLALDSLLHGHPDDAARNLIALEAIEHELDAARRLDVHELRGRIALANGRYDAALAGMERLKTFAELLGLSEIGWRAELGRGEALEGLGKNNEALAAYESAEEILDRQGLRIALSAGRGTFFGDREHSARRLIDLLLRLDRGEESCSAARRSRLRAIRHLEQSDGLEMLTPERRERWDRVTAEYRRRRKELEQGSQEVWGLAESQRRTLAAERARIDAELDRALEQALLDRAAASTDFAPAAREPEELHLVFHPLDRGWLVCARDAQGVSAARVDGAISASSLLEPYGKALATAKRVLVSPHGAARALDFHVLLAERIPVAYALDLAAKGAAREKKDLALIVADPRDDLISAGEEGRRLNEKLSRERWTVRLLNGRAATGDNVRAGLASARLFHFAGHGNFAGLGGWRTALQLAGGAELTIGDLLALEEVPEVVVLSGCKTGATDERASGETLGMAHAFLLAGSRAVVASVRPIEDQLAASMTRALYEEGVQALLEDPSAVLARAQRRLRRDDPSSDWGAFRVLVR
jgi:cellulose synthase operon protein C